MLIIPNILPPIINISLVGKEYYPKQLDNIKNANMDGYAGDVGVPIDRVQMWVE